MRVLTKKEHEVFRVAFNCICRVVAITHTTTNLFEIKIFSKRESKNIPSSIIRLFSNDTLSNIQSKFCNMNEKEAIDSLIHDCFTKGIQPNTYIFSGLLGVQKVKVCETTYDHTEDGRYAA
jgi:hypothetical protein